MAKDKEMIKQEIEEFKTQNDGVYGDYYIGITNDINRRIVESNESIQEHIRAGNYTRNAPLYNAEAKSNAEALEIETYFQDLGMHEYNSGGVGTDDSKFIYCFKLAEGSKYLINEERNDNSQLRKKISNHLKKYQDFKQK